MRCAARPHKPRVGAGFSLPAYAPVGASRGAPGRRAVWGRPILADRYRDVTRRAGGRGFVARLFKVERANDAIVEPVAEVVPVTGSMTRRSRGALATLTFAPSHPSLKRPWSQQEADRAAHHGVPLVGRRDAFESEPEVDGAERRIGGRHRDRGTPRPPVAARPAEYGSVAVGDRHRQPRVCTLTMAEGGAGGRADVALRSVHAARPSATPRSGLLQLWWSSLGRAVATRSPVHLGHVEPFTRSLSASVRSGLRLHRRLDHDGAC